MITRFAVILEVEHDRRKDAPNPSVVMSALLHSTASESLASAMHSGEVALRLVQGCHADTMLELEKQYRKQSHGCTDANCQECDG